MLNFSRKEEKNQALVIYAQEHGTGVLKAKGTTYAAGIGSTRSANGGNVTINGGNITATGGLQAAGIGGGQNGKGCTLIINGGSVTATGANSGAGIGGGYESAGGNVTINGGTVEATGGRTCAGIGGAMGKGPGTVTINGGTVTATGNDGGAGIGSGDLSEDDGGTVIITGGTVTAIGGDSAAGIGSGLSSEDTGRTIIITGGIVTATGNDGAAGIGGGFSAYDYNRTITITGGIVTATGIDGGAGIGGGYYSDDTGSTVTITGGTVTATGDGGGAGIGGGYYCQCHDTLSASFDVMNAGDTAPGSATTVEDYSIARNTYAYIHTHTWENGKCSVCGYECTHEYDASGECTICGEKVTVLYKNYLVEGHKPKADGTKGLYNRYSYYLDKGGNEVVLDDAVYDADKDVTFKAWYLRTMIQSKQEDENVRLRFITMLDENLANYKKAGFVYSVDGGEYKLATSECNTSFLANNKTVSIADYSDADDYFVLQTALFDGQTVELNPKITVKPYVELMTGETLYGNDVTFQISVLTGTN